MKKAIILARVSTGKQAREELPIESQIERCRKKADELGADVAKVFIEGGVSGRRDKRDTFQEAIDYCGVFDVDYFITWDTARFARHRALAAWTKYNLRRGGTELVYVSQNIDTTTDEGWLLEGFFELVDEQQSRRIAKDTLRSMMKNAAAGHYNGGIVPFGYVVVPDGKRKRLAVIEEEAKIVRRIFSMCLEGSGSKAIALWLNRMGLTRRGGAWTKDTVHHALTNWVYGGYVTFRPRLSRARRKADEENVIRTKSHPEIIDEETFQRAQAAIAARLPERDRGSPKSQFVFTGLLRCGGCGSAMQIRTGTSSTGKVHSYYQCGGNLRGKGCSPRAIPAHAFDTVIVQQVLDELLSEERFLAMAADLNEIAGTWATERAASREVLVERLRDAERRRKNLFDLLELHGREAPNLGDLTVRLRELNDQMKEIERSLAALEDAEPPAPTAQSIEEAAELVANVFGRAEPAEMRGFLGSFIDRIVLKDGSLEYHYHPDRLFDVRNTPEGHPGDESNVRPAP